MVFRSEKGDIMKKNTFTRLILCVTALLLALSVAACGEKQKDDEAPTVNSIDITISIDYPESAEMDDVTQDSFAIEEDSSVLEAIQLYCNVNEMPVTIETTGGTVVGINDLLNGDIFAARTWQFKVNGELCTDPAGDVTLKDGDNLEWVYIK